MTTTQRILWSYIWFCVGLVMMAVAVVFGSILPLSTTGALFIGALIGSLFLAAGMVAGDWIARGRLNDLVFVNNIKSWMEKRNG